MAGEQGGRHGSGRSTTDGGDGTRYQGTLGRTRTELVQVWMPDGQIRVLPVYTGVDAATDPELATLARAGTLHHLADGVDLAIAFVYHDARASLFLLVVPEALRHRALALRAEHMALVAADSEVAVPHYVRELEVVIGAAGLQARSESTQPSQVPSAAPAEGELDFQARSLAAKERELARRERLVAARERSGGAGVFSLPAPSVSDAEIEEIDDAEMSPHERALIEAEIEQLDEDLDDGDEIDDLEEVEEVEDLDADAVDEDDDDVEEVSSEDALDDLDDDSVVRAVFLHDSTLLGLGPVDAVAVAPDGFADDDSLELSLVASGGRVWLFVRGRPASSREGVDIDLLLQLDPDADVPVVLVTLVFGMGEAPELRRGIVDLVDPEQLEALKLLEQHFEVELVSWSGAGTMDHWATLRTPREANVRALLSYLEKHGEVERSDWRVAAERLLLAPLPWFEPSHPFRPDINLDPPRTATEAAVLLDELGEWLTPERRQRVKLAWCVPDETVDGRSRASIAYALDWGLSLPTALATRALELGIEKDEPALLLRRIEGLCRTSREPDYGGLEESVLRALWSEALEQAARLGVSLSDQARDLAKLHAGERALVHATALADPHDAELEPLRERIRAQPPDREALEELARRGGYRDLLRACRAAAKLEAEVTATLFAQIARRGDPVAIDALLSLLSQAEEPPVRAGAALSLAARHAVNAIEELAAHVGREPEPDWQLFALALGRYGGGSFRAIARALTNQKVEQERAAHVYAHLALHGARAQVRAKARARNVDEATLAERALTLASEMKDGKKPPLGLEQQGVLTVFCQVFDRSFSGAATVTP